MLCHMGAKGAKNTVKSEAWLANIYFTGHHIICQLKLSQFKTPLSTGRSFLSHSSKAACQLPEQQCSDCWNWKGLMPSAEDRPHAVWIQQKLLRELGTHGEGELLEHMLEQDKAQERYINNQLQTALETFRMPHPWTLSQGRELKHIRISATKLVWTKVLTYSNLNGTWSQQSG